MVNIESSQILDALPAIVSVYNIKTGEYVYVNDGVKVVLGYDKSEFIKKGMDFVASLVHLEDLPGIIQKNNIALKEVNKKNKKHPDLESFFNFEYRVRHKNGDWIWLQTDGKIFARDIKGRVEYVINSSVDITYRKNIEAIINEKLLESKKKYETFLNQSSEGIWRFELDVPIPINYPIENQVKLAFKYGYLAECNRAMALMYGFTQPDDLVGARLDQFIIPTDIKNIEYLKSFILSGYNLLDAESHEKDAQGHDKYFINNLVGIIKNNCLIGAWGTQRDITERKLIEERKDDFIALASHELKTPVSIISLYVSLLKRQFTSGDIKKSASNIIKLENATQRLVRLIYNILDASKIQMGKSGYDFKRLELNKFTYSTISELQKLVKTHKITARKISKCYIYADEEKLKSVLINIINNAKKYSDAGSEIVVGIKAGHKEATLYVKDEGRGIPDNLKRHIFERFYQVDPENKKYGPGLGLGLYITKEIIENHKGKIWVEDNKPKGSVFFVNLPFHKLKPFKST